MNIDKDQELETSRRMLRELSDLAEHATLTGSLSGGSGRAAQRYNGILARLVELEAVSASLFKPLPDNASFDDIGVDSRLLAAHLNGDRKSKRQSDPGVLLRLAPFVESSDLSALVREQMRSNGSLDMEMVTNLAPFLDSKMLGELVRMNMGAAPSAGAQPDPESNSARGIDDLFPNSKGTTATAPDFTPVASPDHQPPKAEDLLELLKNPHLSEEERAELVSQLARSVAPK